MKKIIIPLIGLMFLAACLPIAKKATTEIVQQTIPEDPVSTSTKAIIFEKQEFALSKKVNLELQEGFQKILDIAYKKTVDAHSEEDPREIGFIYSMKPTGAINPFAEVEVSCIIQERHQKKGQDYCGTFFAALQEEYTYLLHPEKRPVESTEEENGKKEAGSSSANLQKK